MVAADVGQRLDGVAFSYPRLMERAGAGLNGDGGMPHGLPIVESCSPVNGEDHDE